MTGLDARCRCSLWSAARICVRAAAELVLNPGSPNKRWQTPVNVTPAFQSSVRPCQAARQSSSFPRGDFAVRLVLRAGLGPDAGWLTALSRGRKSCWWQECGPPGPGEGDRLRWGLCWLPVMVIRCVLEPPGEIRSFPGSRCKRRTPCGLPPDLRSPAGAGEGENTTRRRDGVRGIRLAG